MTNHIQRVLRTLRQDIVTCRLGPGLVIQDSELARQLGVSTTPVREALAQLQLEGLVEVLPYRTKRIAPLDRKAASDFYTVFKALFLLAVSKGSPNVRADGLRVMVNVFADLEKAHLEQDFESYYRHQRRFLNPIIAASGNREIEKVILLSSHWLHRAMFVLRGYDHQVRLDYSRRALDSLLVGNAADCVAALTEMTEELGRQLAGLPAPE